MKTTQAWGWLVAGVLAAGLNASYHDGGLQWAHQIADNLGHNSAAILALAGGNAERLLTEAQVLTARSETASGGFEAALSRVESGLAHPESGWAHFDAMSAREQAQATRLQANRERLESRGTRVDPRIGARIAAQTARIGVPAVAINAMVVRVPPIPCPRVRVTIPRLPAIRIPAPVIDFESGSGPI